MTVGMGLVCWVAGRALSAPWPCSEPALWLTVTLAYPESIRNLLWAGLLSVKFSLVSLLCALFLPSSFPIV